MSLGALFQHSFSTSLLCCFPLVHRRTYTVKTPNVDMAPIALSPLQSPNSTISSLTMTNGPLSPTLESMDSLRMPKLSVLKKSSFVRPRFGRSTSVAFEGHGSGQEFLRFLKNERFRYMPHDGSSWDKVLKWAENIGGVVLQAHAVLHEFLLNSEACTSLICDSCTSLIQVHAVISLMGQNYKANCQSWVPNISKSS
jgi:hypothetical protein